MGHILKTCFKTRFHSNHYVLLTITVSWDCDRAQIISVPLIFFLSVQKFTEIILSNYCIITNFIDYQDGRTLKEGPGRLQIQGKSCQGNQNCCKDMFCSFLYVKETVSIYYITCFIVLHVKGALSIYFFSS